MNVAAVPPSEPTPTATPTPAIPTATPVRPAARRTTDPFGIDPHLDLQARWGLVMGRRWQRASYLGSSGDRIPARWRAARRPGRRPVVILGHGHGGDARSMSEFFGSVASRRVHVLAPNHPFHGHGRRVPGQDICPQDTDLLVSRWIQAVRDLRHAVRAVAARKDVDPGRIGYLGFSLGACLGALLAAHEPRLFAAVLIAPAADWQVLAASQSYWKIGWKTDFLPRWLKVPRLRTLLATIDPTRTIARFAPRPLLVVVGKNDRVISSPSGIALYKAAGKGKVLIHHPGGHGPNRVLRRKAMRWLERRLRK